MKQEVKLGPLWATDLVSNVHQSLLPKIQPDTIKELDDDWSGNDISHVSECNGTCSLIHD